MRLRGVRGRRHARRALIAFSCAAVAFAASDVALVRVVGASQDDTQAANYGLYNGQVYATADRQQVGTTVDNNFAGGAFNNFYPLAYSGVAVAGTNATATWADTGPFAQAVLGGGANGEVVNQPQYVHAQFPGNEHPGAFNAPTGSSASASVTSASATATSYATTAGNPPGSGESSAATQDALATSLAQWKAKYMGAPVAASAASPSTPADGTDGDTGTDSVYFDTSKGFVTTGSSRVAHASFGGGMIVIDNVRVDLTIMNPGDGSKPATAESILVGSASINGVPVSIGQNGVTVGPQTVPADQVQQASQQLNDALAQSGFSIHLVTPIEAVQGFSEHVDAVGVVVNWSQPAALTPPGVPSQFVTHTLGEVVIDNEATLSPSASSLLGGLSSGLGSTFGGGFSSSTSTVTAPAAATPAPQRAAPPKAPAAPAGVRITPSRPLWLLLLYLAWQTLLIGTAASIYLWRSGARLATLAR